MLPPYYWESERMDQFRLVIGHVILIGRSQPKGEPPARILGKQLDQSAVAFKVRERGGPNVKKAVGALIVCGLVHQGERQPRKQGGEQAFFETVVGHADRPANDQRVEQREVNREIAIALVSVHRNVIEREQ